MPRARPRCHLTLAPETIDRLGAIAEAAGVSTSRVVDALAYDLTEHGVREIVAAIRADLEAPR